MSYFVSNHWLMNTKDIKMVLRLINKICSELQIDLNWIEWINFWQLNGHPLNWAICELNWMVLEEKHLIILNLM